MYKFRSGGTGKHLITTVQRARPPTNYWPLPLPAVRLLCKQTCSPPSTSTEPSGRSNKISRYAMLLNRFVLAIKNQSRETLRAWSYQCESILAQRSRRLQQLFTFYQSVYGTQGLKQLWRAYYRRDLQPPLRGNQRCKKSSGSANSSAASSSMQSDSEASISSCQQHALILDAHNAPAGEVRIQAQEDRNWEPYFSKNEFSIWRREERSSLYSYKVYARFDDITADDFLHVQTDLDYRREWDDTALRLELISEDPVPGSNSHLIYWEMQWPRLFANRDYVYCRRYFKDEAKNMIFICSRAATHNTYPTISGKVRVTDYWSLMVIKPFRGFHEPGLHFVLTYYDDPGIPIPQNIKSWVTQKQMPEFLTKMYVATKNYACSRALKMKDMFNSFNIINDEYTANEQRGSWLGSLSRHRRKLQNTNNEKDR
ncbi:CG6565 [Drosophila busckii]|uniref:CG6565 n=1 Tax=Drosophila busckii TaxID=30019 RepID=A0A0M4E2R8_DROBS|nr:CG6565 [Drosophila busckii]